MLDVRKQKPTFTEIPYTKLLTLPIYKNVYNAFEFPEHRLFPQFAYL